jgi:hypothetical protein
MVTKTLAKIAAAGWFAPGKSIYNNHLLFWIKQFVTGGSLP